MFDDSTDVARTIGLAIWSWVVFAGVLTLSVSLTRPATVVVGQRASDGMRQQIQEELGIAGSDFVHRLISTLTFDFGGSWVISPGTGVWELVVPRLGITGTLVVEALVIAAVLIAAVLAVGRGDRDDRVTQVGGQVVGAVPAFAWTYLLFLLVIEAGMPLPNPGREFGVVTAFLPALALALPVAATGMRVADLRDEAGFSGPERDLAVLHGWVGASWFVGAVVVVEQVFGVSGLGNLWFAAAASSDVPLFAAVTATLAVPLILASVLREVLSSGGSRGPDTATEAVSVEADGGERAVDVATFVHLVRENRRVRAGAAGFAGLLVVGLVGSFVLSGPTGPPRGGLVVAYVADALVVVTLITLFTVLIGGLVGIPLGITAARSRRDGTLVRFALDYAANVPFVVFVILGLLAFVASGNAIDSLVVGLGVALLAGLALAPLALRLTERELARGRDRSSALVPVASLLASAGGFVAFLVGQLGVLGVGIDQLSRVVVPTGQPVPALLGTIIVVGLPALSLFVLGDGLRKAIDSRS